jgi:hypothetical protein
VIVALLVIPALHITSKKASVGIYSGREYPYIQSNLDYPNPFGQGGIFEHSDEKKVWIMLTTPTNSIV